MDVDELFATVRRAAPFAELSRAVFEGVLDMLSGRYPSDEFAELRPRLTWDRIAGTLTPARARSASPSPTAARFRTAGSTASSSRVRRRARRRVGELDEEMVFERAWARRSCSARRRWRIEEITHDRVLVSPAPGEPGKMPFWKGDGPARPLELGLAIGRLVRELRGLPPAAAVDRLVRDHDLDRLAAENLLQYLADQAAATRRVPDDRTIVVERTRDELGDWRVCVLSPLGGRVHAPWALAVVARVREESGIDVEVLWADDGFVVRFPETDTPPDTALAAAPAEEVEELVVRQLGASALFAATLPGGRGPRAAAAAPPARVHARRLWQQRKRAADLLAVAARYGSFPVLLETYRECLRDIFDLPALVETLRQVGHAHASTWSPSIRRCLRRSRPRCCSATSPTSCTTAMRPWRSAGRRRSRWITAQLRELLGDAELRELLDPARDRRLRTAAAASRSALPREECGCRARSADPHR